MFNYTDSFGNTVINKLKDGFNDSAQRCFYCQNSKVSLILYDEKESKKDKE